MKEAILFDLDRTGLEHRAWGSSLFVGCSQLSIGLTSIILDPIDKDGSVSWLIVDLCLANSYLRYDVWSKGKEAK